MREDEKAARAMGINITRMRLLAFSLAAMWAGLCGVFFAAKQAFISPESFSFMESVTILAMVILGGMGSIPGVVVGAVVLSLLPEVLRGVSEYRMITLAGLMILMMIFRPQGLFPNVRRKLELEDRGGGREGGAMRVLEVRGPARATSAGCARSTASTSTSTRARWCRSSARTAPARPPSSTA